MREIDEKPSFDLFDEVHEIIYNEIEPLNHTSDKLLNAEPLPYKYEPEIYQHAYTDEVDSYFTKAANSRMDGEQNICSETIQDFVNEEFKIRCQIKPVPETYGTTKAVAITRPSPKIFRETVQDFVNEEFESECQVTPVPQTHSTTKARSSLLSKNITGKPKRKTWKKTKPWSRVEEVFLVGLIFENLFLRGSLSFVDTSPTSPKGKSKRYSSSETWCKFKQDYDRSLKHHLKRVNKLSIFEDRTPMALGRHFKVMRLRAEEKLNCKSVPTLKNATFRDLFRKYEDLIYSKESELDEKILSLVHPIRETNETND